MYAEAEIIASVTEGKILITFMYDCE